MAVDIQASFSKKEKVRNGLENISKLLTDDPLTRRVVVGVIECTRTVVDHVNGDTETPVVKFVGIEPMLSQKEAADARKLYERAFKARTGHMPEDELPLEGQEQLPLRDEQPGGRQ